MRAFTFESHIPLQEWKAKKPQLEVFLNQEILNIVNSPEDRNIVHIFTAKAPLTESLEWSDSLIYVDANYINLGAMHCGYAHLNLVANPHTFVAGETGSGKTNLLKSVIYQCLYHGHTVKLIDFKRGVSFSAFSNHLEIYSEYEEIAVVLDDLVEETKRRLDLFREMRVEELSDYNKEVDNVNSENAENKLSRIVVVIDELAELMRASSKEATRNITASLETLTRLSRAVGINLIMGLQRPDATIVNGQIKNNVSTRICGRFIDPEPSRIMLGTDRATKLPKVKGRFVMRDDEVKEFQAFYMKEESMGHLFELNYQYVVAKEHAMYEAQLAKEAKELSLAEELAEAQGVEKEILPEEEFRFVFDDVEVEA